MDSSAAALVASSATARSRAACSAAIAFRASAHVVSRSAWCRSASAARRAIARSAVCRACRASSAHARAPRQPSRAGRACPPARRAPGARGTRAPRPPARSRAVTAASGRRRDRYVSAPARRRPRPREGWTRIGPHHPPWTPAPPRSARLKRRRPNRSRLGRSAGSSTTFPSGNSSLGASSATGPSFHSKLALQRSWGGGSGPSCAIGESRTVRSSWRTTSSGGASSPARTPRQRPPMSSLSGRLQPNSESWNSPGAFAPLADCRASSVSPPWENFTGPVPARAVARTEKTMPRRLPPRRSSASGYFGCARRRPGAHARGDGPRLLGAVATSRRRDSRRRLAPRMTVVIALTLGRRARRAAGAAGATDAVPNGGASRGHVMCGARSIPRKG